MTNNNLKVIEENLVEILKIYGTSANILKHLGSIAETTDYVVEFRTPNAGDDFLCTKEDLYMVQLFGAVSPTTKRLIRGTQNTAVDITEYAIKATDVYRADFVMVPKEYRVVKFAPPKAGDTYLTSKSQGVRRACYNRPNEGSYYRLILVPNEPATDAKEAA